MKHKFRSYRNVVVPIGASLLFGCGGSSTELTSDQSVDISVDTVTEESLQTTVPDTEGTLSVSLTGLVDDSLIEGAVVTVKEAGTGKEVAQGVSDSNGVATLPNVTSGGIYNVTVSHGDFASGNFPLAAPFEADEVTELEVSMVETEHEQIFIGSEGVTVTPANTDGAQVVIPPNAFVDGNGDVVTGEIRVEITTYDVADQELMDNAYGTLDAELPDNQTGTLYTYGAVDFTFYDAETGEELQLAVDQVAEITIPLYIDEHQTGATIQENDAIGLWWLDLESGLWKEHANGCTVVASEASPTGLACQGNVDHFTRWNVDAWRRLSRVTTTSNEEALTINLSNEVAINVTYESQEGLEGPVCLSYQLDNNLGNSPAGVACGYSDGLVTVMSAETLNVTPSSDTVSRYCLKYQFNAPGYTSLSLENATNNVGDVESLCYEDYDDIRSSAMVTTTTTDVTDTWQWEWWFNNGGGWRFAGNGQNSWTVSSTTATRGDGNGVQISLDAHLDLANDYVSTFSNKSISGY